MNSIWNLINHLSDVHELYMYSQMQGYHTELYWCILIVCEIKGMDCTTRIRSMLISVLHVFPDIFRVVLCGREPLQEPTNLHRVHRGDVQGQETPRDAPSHLCHIRGRLSQHATRYSSLSAKSYQ